MQITINLFGSTREQLLHSLDSARGLIEESIGQLEGENSIGGSYEMTMPEPARIRKPFGVVDGNTELVSTWVTEQEAEQAANRISAREDGPGFVTRVVPENENSLPTAGPSENA